MILFYLSERAINNMLISLGYSTGAKRGCRFLIVPYRLRAPRLHTFSFFLMVSARFLKYPVSYDRAHTAVVQDT